MSTSGDGRSERRHPHPSGPHPSVPSRLLLVRHGESDWNRDRRIQGQLDPPLSDGGQRQARLLGERLARHRFVAFYASDLCRSMQTAAAVGEAMGTDPVPLPELREVALGEWEGKTSAQLAEEYPDRWEAWVRHPSWDLVPEGEGAKPFETRVRNAVYELLDRHPEGDVLCVTHGGVIQVVLGEATGRASDGPFPFVIDNCSLTVVQQTRRGLVITSVNDTCHLADGEGPPRPP